ncbi:exopolysaccharide transport family protein [Roseibium aggregatum]|uniref:exopolysaccharide transport family protein n=1 Tax=Roseibium aggregatum TaxID=187304 RepID=UPI00094B7440|nr:exopolysaccharide transport family protein [Roseibium aggregatum]UFI01171.1 exopolysaccharide transport family protein [Roseibium aggregatum]
MNAERQTHSEDDMALDLGGLLRTIGRSLGWLVPLTLFVTVVVFLGLQFVAPKYKGEARLIIESTDNLPGASRGQEEERALLDSEGVVSQVQLLKSADLARRVANKLNLAAIPEFDANDDGSLVNLLLSLVGFGNETEGNSEEERVLKHYYENLEIYRLEGSRVIAVDYTAESPVLAAKVANTIVDEYLSVQSSAKRQTTEQASAALEPQIVELRREVQAARQAVSDFRARADLLIGADNIPLNQQQLAETSTAYSDAQSSKAEAQAKADLIRELLNSGGSLETASDVLNSALIQRLRERQVEIQSNIAELSITLLPNHPQLKALQSQLGDYDRQIRSEARKILQGLENDAKVQDQRAKALGARLEELKTAAAKSNADQARLAELEREANAKAAQLDQLLLSFQEADSRLRAQVLPADARIISRASVPVEPDSPKIIASTIIAALVAFILGCAFLLMREFLNGNALYRMQDGSSEGQRVAPRMDERPQSGPQNTVRAENPGWGGGYGQTVASYRIDPGEWSKADTLRDAEPSVPETAASIDEPTEETVPEQTLEPQPQPQPQASEKTQRPKGRIGILSGKLRGRKKKTGYDHDVSPDWVGDMRGSKEAEAEVPGAEVAPVPVVSASKTSRQAKREEQLKTTHADDVEAAGRVVVLSVDDEALSHELAFDLIRKAAGRGKSSLIMEVFPDQTNLKGAEGFSDIVAGTAPFAKVVYRDAGSKAHIIEAGRVEITDEMVNSERFKLALEAIKSTYETVVVDLGAIDGSLASARMLSFADRVLIAASAPDHGHELQSAANLLAHNTGAKVEVVISGGTGPGPRRNGDGHAA